MIKKYFTPAIPITNEQLYDMARNWIKPKGFSEAGLVYIDEIAEDSIAGCGERGPVEIDPCESDKFKGRRKCSYTFFDKNIGAGVEVWFKEPSYERSPVEILIRNEEIKRSPFPSHDVLFDAIDGVKTRLERILRFDLQEVPREAVAA